MNRKVSLETKTTVRDLSYQTDRPILERLKRVPARRRSARAFVVVAAVSTRVSAPVIGFGSRCDEARVRTARTRSPRWWVLGRKDSDAIPLIRGRGRG